MNQSNNIGKLEDSGNLVPRGRVDRYWNAKGIFIEHERFFSGSAISKIDAPWLHGVDEALDHFKLRSIEFGNWMNQEDRSNFLYWAMLSLHHLAKVLNVPDSAIGFNGKLSLSFGARGASKAMAHYERIPYVIINLTKTNGFESLAHEYAHAVDNILSLYLKSEQSFVSGGDSTRKEISKNVLEKGNLFEILLEQMFNQLYFDGNAETDFLNTIKRLPDYWHKRAEVLARTFEVYIFNKLKKAGIQNTFLVAKGYDSKRYPDQALLNKVEPVIDKILNKAFQVFSGQEINKGTVKNDGTQATLFSSRPKLSGLGFEYQEQNKALNFNGYLPQYQKLESYDHLIDKSTGKRETVGHGGLELTVKTIKKVVQEHRHEVSKLAKHLYTGKADQDNFNVWHFIKTNVVYGYDTPGIEEIRTPGRTWADRFSKVDCEDYGIFANALLLEMGYKPKLQIVALNNNDFFQHIYAVLNGQANDPVLNTFNKHPDKITNTMEVQVLSGVSKPLCGIGAIEFPDAVTRELMRNQSQIIANYRKSRNPQLLKELRKVRFMIRLNGTVDRDRLLPVMPLIDDISPEGNYIVKDESYLDAIEEYFAQTDDEVLDGLSGLGKKGWFKKAAKNILNPVALTRTIARKVAPKAVKKFEASKVGQRLQKAENKLKATAQKLANSKAFKAIKKYSPTLIFARNSFLLLLKLNFLKMARKFAYGFATEAQAREKGLDMTEWKNFVNKTNEAVAKFEKLGGSRKGFYSAVMKGRAAKKAGLKGGLGVEPASISIAAAITGATAILAALKPMMQQMNLKKLTNGSETDEDVTENPDEYTDIDVDSLQPTPEEEGYASEEEAAEARNMMSEGGNRSFNPDAGSFVSALGFMFKAPLLLSIIDFSNPVLMALSAIITAYCIIGFLIMLPLSWMGYKVDKYFSPLNLFKNFTIKSIKN